MNTTAQFLITVCLLFCIVNCGSQKVERFFPKIVYKTNDLTVTQISDNAFEHTSYLQTNDFGKVPCNGLIAKDGNETIIFDTPTNDKGAEELIKWITEKLNCKINAVIPTHFHDDCLGGLKAFHENGIPSYAYFKTIAFAKAKNFTVPQNSFNKSLNLKLGAKHVTVKFFGEGHTRDNVIGYFPSEQLMFGGCLIKEIDATKGFLGDANVSAWPTTVEKIRKEYPKVQIIVPGHGERGDKKLLDYTIRLFEKQ
ncbi:subclass B1 metallo-beta-lactamase [Pedobacter sp. SL55]|uniref:subclass B1 metallo-beta-lactamase n=1 Tax=Pedobacter sp. SL55 TaxID=2995161 RepID=UPI00226D58E8|nr:subclass B1 metallo-beta-lactamase [Pedobacter sp. SL55]WAC41561.1 subclass B1 metallo-beta-lactamase [Pedobacter sp. SL55]